MAEDTELDRLKERVRILEDKVAALEGIGQILRENLKPDVSANGGGELVERDGLRFMTSPHETPEAAALRIRRALDEADGKLT